jgi:peptidoglycan/xylan/chitin deacetylase (PgdA/CDA1 family)
VKAGASCAAALSIAGGYWLSMSTSSQVFGQFPYHGEPAQQAVALTFDDGPNEPFTSQIGRALESAGVRGTFFQVGRAVQRFPDTSRALLDAGHVIGNHSHTHRFGRGFGRRAIADEIDRAQDAFAEHLDLVPALYRPPWLVRTPAMFPLLRDRRMSPVSGTFCHALEVAQINPSKIAGVALRRARPGSMIIFHDGYNGVGANRASTVDAIKRLLDGLIDAGHALVTVDALLGLRAYQTT